MLKNAVQNNQNSNGVTYQSGDQEINLTPNVVRQCITTNPKVTSQEIFIFIKKCEALHLNPFLGEINLIKWGNSPANYVVTAEAHRKRASRNPHFRGMKAGIVVVRNGNTMKYMQGALMIPGDQLIGGWCEVYRDDRDYPTHVEVSLDEFDKKQSTWKSMKKTMIRKTAEVNALREAFPESLNGSYTEEDVDINEKTQPRKSVKADDGQKSNVAQLVNGSHETKNAKPKNEPKSESKSGSKDIEELDPKEEQSVEQILNAQNNAADSMEDKDVDKKEDVENDAQSKLF